jgi:hypothetical protein
MDPWFVLAVAGCLPLMLSPNVLLPLAGLRQAGQTFISGMNEFSSPLALIKVRGKVSLPSVYSCVNGDN